MCSCANITSLRSVMSAGCLCSSFIGTLNIIINNNIIIIIIQGTPSIESSIILFHQLIADNIDINSFHEL